MTHQTFRQFQATVWDFYTKHKRILPWRETKNPYFILVSEMMLQQTQVPRVVSKYLEWIQNFPTIKSLAEAPFEDVLRSWSGLGYNRRALFLHKTAQTLTRDFQGTIPNDSNILVQLPGIGKNTAASIVVFSYNTPLVFIETNIRRVFIHEFFHDQTNIADSEILPLIKQTMDEKNPREWYYALMDYGSYLGKVIENPNRKSKHYTKQSPLEGSVRQVRGRILKILLKEKTLTRKELKEKVNLDPTLLDEALKQLSLEGFILKKNRKISIIEG